MAAVRAASTMTVALIVALASCARGGDAAADTPPSIEPPVVTVIAHDYAFSTPSPISVPAGPVTFRMINAGKELHMMGVVWLGAHTFKDFMAAIQGDTTFQGSYEVGGPDAVMPGDTSYATVILEPGHVALACWVEGEDGKMHVMKGMMTAFD